jgi:hypothetical protein
MEIDAIESPVAKIVDDRLGKRNGRRSSRKTLIGAHQITPPHDTEQWQMALLSIVMESDGCFE